MKNFKYVSSLVLLCAGVLFCRCSKMVEVENESYNHIGGCNTMNNTGSEKCYADLRAYKQQAANYGRPAAFGWYSNQSPTGTYRRGYLTSMPDSMDIASMWSGASNRFSATPEQKKDKESMQKVKGTKLLEVILLFYIGKGRTPDPVYAAVEKQAEKEGWTNDQARVEEAKEKARQEFWGYGGIAGSDNHKQALVRFARALCDSLVANNWDGYDIDRETGSGVSDMDGTLSTNADLVYLVEEMNKYISPKGDPDHRGHRPICIDGHFGGLTKDLGGYADYWIDQAYGRVTHFDYYGVDPKTIVTTDNFELSLKGGGQSLGQVRSMPPRGYKGGVGAYRSDNDYDNIPNYKWVRQAIQTNQQVFKERMGQTTQP